MFKKIIVPLDGSPLAEQTLTFLPRFASPLQTHLDLVSVLQPWVYALGMTEATPISVINDLREQWQIYLNEQEVTLQSQGYSVKSHILEGDVANEILALAESEGSDLIAMSTHGRSGFSRLALGSISERVLQNTRTPLLLVRESSALQTSAPLKQLLTPLDGSNLAEKALPVAAEMAHQTGAELTLLRVIQALDEHNKRLLFKSDAEAEESMQQWKTLSSRYLEQMAYSVYREGLKVHSEMLIGDPDKIICETAESLPADLIVMSTHGRSGVDRWVYGSVANKVLRNASCPVLLVRNQADQST